jgi:hypothetical protein
LSFGERPGSGSLTVNDARVKQCHIGYGTASGEMLEHGDWNLLLAELAAATSCNLEVTTFFEVAGGTMRSRRIGSRIDPAVSRP